MPTVWTAKDTGCSLMYLPAPRMIGLCFNSASASKTPRLQQEIYNDDRAMDLVRADIPGEPAVCQITYVEAGNCFRLLSHSWPRGCEE
jgi:hypothetical protein